jgi:GNAT superfamily N-acetyltransferase
VNDTRIAAPLFTFDSIRAIELRQHDIPALQSFYDDNDDYFHAVTGEPPASDEAQKALDDPLPPGFPYTKKWLIGAFDDAGSLLAMANVVSDLLAAHVWHVGLFIAGRPLRGTGLAHRFHAALENWCKRSGAHWMRLGVVDGNVRAERFWTRLGYIELRRREGIEMGRRVNTIRVMMKPLEGGTRDEYLELVARDRSES